MNRNGKKPQLHRRKKTGSKSAVDQLLSSKRYPLTFLLVGISAFIFGLVWDAVWAVLFLLFGGLLILLSVIVGFIYLRNQILNNVRFHEHICPNCEEEDVLKRTSRRRSDRFLGWLFSLPIRRHICSHCGWVGIRIHRYKLR